MTEPTEPTREQIEKRIAQLEALVRFPQYAAIWDTDLVVYRMALRTLDAEAQLDHARRRIDAFTARDNAADETIAVLTRQLAAMTERAEKAERLAAVLRVVAEHEVADAIVKSRERATRIGWIDHATGDYEERAVPMLMDGLAAGSAVCAFLRMVGVWTLEDRAEKAERERHVAVSVMREMRVVWDAAVAQRDAMRAKLASATQDAPAPTTDARLDCESSSLLLLSTWARRVMMREKNRAKGVPSESIRTLLWMARDELFEAYSAIEEDAPTDDILAELGDAAAIIGFAMREIEKRRKA